MALAACSASQGASEPPAGEALRQRLANPAAQARGRRLFLASCALCHGEAADGRGRRRDALSSPPTDFTRLAWRRRVSPGEVFEAIRQGRPGTPMAAWKSLGEEETWDLVAYLLAIAEEGT